MRFRENPINLQIKDKKYIVVVWYPVEYEAVYDLLKHVCEPNEPNDNLIKQL